MVVTTTTNKLHTTKWPPDALSSIRGFSSLKLLWRGSRSQPCVPRSHSRLLTHALPLSVSFSGC